MNKKSSSQVEIAKDSSKESKLCDETSYKELSFDSNTQFEIHPIEFDELSDSLTQVNRGKLLITLRKIAC